MPRKSRRRKSEWILENNMSLDEHKEFMGRLAQDYPALIKQIDFLVDQIAERVVQFDPLALLQRGYHALSLAAIKQQTEAKRYSNDTFPLRMVDYVQSIIVARPLRNTKKPSDEEYFELESLVDKLYSTINLQYHIQKSAHAILSDPSYNAQQDAFSVRVQMLWMNVSVDRYLIHNIPHIQDLISCHSEVLTELFGVSSNELVDAIAAIQHSLTRGLFAAYGERKEIQLKVLDSLGTTLNGNLSERMVQERLGSAIEKLGLRQKFEDAVRKIEEYDLFDLQKVTKLPTKFLDALSLSPGEDQSFFSPGDHQGWPLRLLPVRTKPFLKYNGRYYCFDNNNLQDQIYRILQMLITTVKPSYRSTWNAYQQEVSERLPLEMLGKLLPGAKHHASIHYQWIDKAKNKTEWAEADGLVVYDDVLLVVEVKGGAFTLASPTTDLDAYVSSIRNLVCKPAIQARRFINELELRGELEIFDKNRKSLGYIRKNEFWRIWGVCVTVDNISDVGTRHTDFKDLGLSFAENPTWVVSLDDLRVFCDVFDSPTVFIHFLEQRLRAYNNPLAHPDDELDYIGMYFTHNNFDMLSKEAEEPSRTIWSGYREIVDNYYAELISGGSPSKPIQSGIHGIFSKVLSKLAESRGISASRACSWLLDFGDEGRGKFNALVSDCIAHQSSGKRIRPASMASKDGSVLVFCLTPGFEAPTKIWMREYAIALVNSMQGRELLVLEIGFDGDDIAWVNGDVLGQHHLKEIEAARLSALSEQYGRSRVHAFRKSGGRKKIGRNEKCPCGSGRKFKACHGSKDGGGSA